MKVFWENPEQTLSKINKGTSEENSGNPNCFLKVHFEMNAWWNYGRNF